MFSKVFELTTFLPNTLNNSGAGTLVVNATTVYSHRQTEANLAGWQRLAAMHLDSMGTDAWLRSERWLAIAWLFH
jgi:hypothetical protein